MYATDGVLETLFAKGQSLVFVEDGLFSFGEVFGVGVGVEAGVEHEIKESGFGYVAVGRWGNIYLLIGLKDNFDSNKIKYNGKSADFISFMCWAS